MTDSWGYLTYATGKVVNRSAVTCEHEVKCSFNLHAWVQLKQIVIHLHCLIERAAEEKSHSCPLQRAPTAFYAPEIWKYWHLFLACSVDQRFLGRFIASFSISPCI
jgi:hypothetical protein